MELLAPQLESHLDTLARHGDPLLEEMEARAAREDFPIVGPVAGRLLFQVTRLLGARSVFEMGSGYGYSTLWFARAVAANGGGVVHHTVWDAGLSEQARGYLERAGLAHLVRFHVSEAVAALRAETGSFDLIFNDINKEAYPASIPVVKSRLRPGGALLVDNMLWSGRIFERGDRTPSTAGVRQATALLFGDAELCSSLLPLRDGLVLSVYQPRGPEAEGAAMPPSAAPAR